MQNPKSSPRHKMPAGFTLPAILVVVGALLILAVGVLLIVGIERNTARSFVDRQRAELAAKAGLEDVSGIFNIEAANDEFVVLQSTLAAPITAGLQSSPQLFLARGKIASGKVSYHYLPLFSTASLPADNSTLAAPVVEPLVGTAAASYIDFETLPYFDKARASWLPVTDSNNKMVARYSYWVEDLQSRVDAGSAGNTKGSSGEHKRYGWIAGDKSSTARFPAPGLNAEDSDIGSDGRDKKPPLDQVALYLMDPTAGKKDSSALDKTIIDGRPALVSPDSVLAVAGIQPPIKRRTDGHLSDSKSSSVEEGLTASVRPYDEKALIPYANGIDPSVAGKSKLNLNALLAKPPATAVDEMAAFIQKGLPKFESRKGGFPNDYLKTLAANAIDYADTDSDGTVTAQQMTAGSYRGLDAYPLLSEVILHIKYQGVKNVGRRKYLLWQMIVFVELWNHSNQKVEGQANVSYENKFRIVGIGTEPQEDFDSKNVLDDPVQAVANPGLSNSDGKYWSAPLGMSGSSKVVLEPNQYQFYRAVTIDYKIDIDTASRYYDDKYPFQLNEVTMGASGISMKWNGRLVDRSDKLLRGNTGGAQELEFTVGNQKEAGLAQIPGHSYGIPGPSSSLFKDVMGDSRQSVYLYGNGQFPLSTNSYPGNISPNRRNIRNATVYTSGSGWVKVYGRVTPSDWPDGGHDTAISMWSPATPGVPGYDPTTYPSVANAREGEAPTYISNRGRFYSATELGRIYDPVMYVPKYDNAADTKEIVEVGKMPPGQVSWPSVEVGSDPSPFYGGGNTLRIGRPEHPAFDRPAKHAPADMPGDHAARLLDLFHAGKSRSGNKSEREGPLVRIEGNINLNTASRDAIRAMAGGLIVSDPVLSKRTSENHSSSTFAAPVTPLEVSVPTSSKEGDVLADAVIRGRPYASPSEVASALNVDGKVAFGNRDLLPDGNKVQWSDAAAEEAFARVYEAATVRSRNFRVWVVGQAVAPTAVTNTAPEILAEVRKAYTVFADPGERTTDGSIDPTKFRIKILNENDF
ncbi:MAG: hypothetical protein ABIT37_06725 [Luteolibacter sp.]